MGKPPITGDVTVMFIFIWSNSKLNLLPCLDVETPYSVQNDSPNILLSGVPDYFDRNKILSGYDLSHYQVPHCIRVFFSFVDLCLFITILF